MLNWIWAGMILVSLVCAAATGRMEALSSAVFSGSQRAVELVFAMAGAMAAWTGLLKVAEAGGLTALLNRALRAASGSAAPFDILPAVWVTSALSLLAALAACYVLEKPHG